MTFLEFRSLTKVAFLAICIWTTACAMLSCATLSCAAPLQNDIPAVDEPAGAVVRKVLPANFQPSRERGDTEVAKLLDELEFMNSGSDRFSDEWLLVLKSLADWGNEAVPELCDELDSTENDMMLRSVSFVLRGINDPRAVPALIRAIPKTLHPPGSDMGLNVKDKRLEKFAHKVDLSRNKVAGEYDFGRPVRELHETLQYLTKHKMDDEQLFGVFKEGTEQQQAMKLQLFQRHSLKWAAWWEANAGQFNVPPEYHVVDLPDYAAVLTVPAVQVDWHYQVTGMHANYMLQSALEPGARTVFIDFDTGRTSDLPERWHAQRDNLPFDEIELWAAEEGFDMVGIRIPTGVAEEQVYVLQSLGMKVWQVDDKRWKTQPSKITLAELLNEGQEVDKYLIRKTDNASDPFGKASYLAITREGTPIMLYVGIQVLDDSLKPGGFIGDDDRELDPVAFHKGRRFAFSVFESAGAEGND